jgi:hypothetical protein
MDEPVGNTTEIRVLESTGAVEGEKKRSWKLQVTHNGSILPEKDLEDPFKHDQYRDIFKFWVDDSFHGQFKDESILRENRLQEARDQIPEYAKCLIAKLGLEDLLGGDAKQNILIIEEQSSADEIQSIGMATAQEQRIAKQPTLDAPMQEKLNIAIDENSVHNLVWELLENLDYWKVKPERVTITRVICKSTTPSSTPQQSGLPNDRPIRILLVIGRDLTVIQQNLKYKEDVAAGLIQHPLMQVIQHLNEIGHKRQIELEILRPATFRDLKIFLGLEDPDSANPTGIEALGKPKKSLQQKKPEAHRTLADSKEKYDIIHLDMHGSMEPKKLVSHFTNFTSICCANVYSVLVACR